MRSGTRRSLLVTSAVLLALLSATITPASALDDQAASVADPTTWTPIGDDVVVGAGAAERLQDSDGTTRATSGYSLIDPSMGLRGSYTLRMVKSGDYTAMSDELQAAAVALERATGANFVVGSPTSNEEPATGQITVKLSSNSPCGTLSTVGTTGCGGPDAYFTAETHEWSTGRVWLFPQATTASHGYSTLLHELGHAVGLGHWDPAFQGRYMRMHCCSYGDLFGQGSIVRYLNGDVMGLRRLAQIGYLDGGVAPKRTPGQVDKPSGSPALDGVTASWWVPPMFGAAVDQYQVQARNTSTLATRTVTGGSGASLRIGNLTGGAHYQVRVRAHNALGWGSWSTWSSPVRATPRCIPTISDVSEVSGFCGSISWMIGSGLASGFPDGTYRPTTSVSRQAMAQFLRAFAEMQDPGSTDGPFPDPGFSDVNPDSVFYDDIAWLAATSIAGGYADGTYRPTDPVSRQAMARFLHGVVEHLYPWSTGCSHEIPDCTGEPFSDVSASNPFRGEISWLYTAGISEGDWVNGSHVFKPAAPTNRAAMAAFIERTYLWHEFGT